MNKQELVDAVGERLGDRKSAAVAVEAVLGTVTAALADGERVALFGFGVFEKVDRAARTARNPSTGGTVDVPATSVPRFRPGQALKDAVSGRSSGTTARTGAAASPTRPAKATAKTTDEAAPMSEGTSEAKSKGKDSKAAASDAKAKDKKKSKAKSKGKGK